MGNLTFGPGLIIGRDAIKVGLHQPSPFSWWRSLILADLSKPTPARWRLSWIRPQPSPVDPSFARACQAGYDRALRAGGHQRDPRRHEPARSSHAADHQDVRAAGITAGGHESSCSGGRGYLPRPWTGVASSQRRPCEPRPVEGHVGDRELPHGGPRRPCRALPRLQLHDPAPFSRIYPAHPCPYTENPRAFHLERALILQGFSDTAFYTKD
jgi:hypothetical protein